MAAVGSKRSRAEEEQETPEIIRRCSSFVKEALAGNDASHDWNHIERVWRLTRTLAAREVDRVGPGQLDVEVAELAALLHDIADWKYSGSETAGVERAREWLTEQGYCAAKKQRVLYIIENVSFHTELGKKEPGPEEPQPEASKLPTLELQIVQDADRLDAIGAIGVARAFTYGGHKKRPLYDLADGASIYRPPEQRATELMSKEEYMQKGKAGSQAKEDTVEHFYEKLLFLKGMMKTDAGRAIAAGRHEFMESYLRQLDAEVDGQC